VLRRAHRDTVVAEVVRRLRKEEEMQQGKEGLREDAVRLLREAHERQGKAQEVPWVQPKHVSHHAGIEPGSEHYEQVVAYMAGERWIRPLTEHPRHMEGVPIYQITPEGFDPLREG
jgi:hypothetical protein